MTWRRIQWPLVWRSSHDRLLRENFELRGAIRSANEELLKHRKLLAGLRTGHIEITRAVEDILR